MERRVEPLQKTLWNCEEMQKDAGFSCVAFP